MSDKSDDVEKTSKEMDRSNKNRIKSISDDKRQDKNEGQVNAGIMTRAQRKKSEFNTSIQGESVNFNNYEEINILEDKDDTNTLVNQSTDELFRPRSSLTRTPPNGITESIGKVENEPQLSKKRARADSSPANLERLKMLKETEKTQVPKERVENNEIITHHNEVHTTNMIDDIMNSLEILHDFLENNETSETKKKKETEAKSALFKTHKCVTALAYRIGYLENEIKHLTRTQIQTPTMPIPELSSESTTANIFTEKTYSMVAQRKHEDRTTQNTITEWKTPPKQDKHEILIKIQEEKNAKVVLSEIKQSLLKNNVNETIKSVNQLQSGGVIMQCNSADQQKKIKEALGSSGNFLIKENNDTDPMLMITGITKGYEPLEFINELVEQNSDIKISLGESVMSKIRFVTKKDCRNNRRENWILQMPPDIFKWFIQNEKISFDLTKNEDALLCDYFDNQKQLDNDKNDPQSLLDANISLTFEIPKTNIIDPIDNFTDATEFDFPEHNQSSFNKNYGLNKSDAETENESLNILDK
ncbi:unnamed protein product [Psylliodes chrysocephalus]|uniref:Uncharacterized protein n=1 Tax=Psylliodes chrysocephalus TaxID=3402493 RepID=A0A9P0CTD5_9CUCU|nr:unnamed protein product [Psylliodes chrysocephala]